jgi:hypothetical protein
MNTDTPKKHKPRSHPHPRQERFERLFEVAFGGFCAGAKFHYLHADGGEYHLDARQQLELVRRLGPLAWNATRFACELFNDEEIEVKRFNEIISQEGAGE